MNNIKLLESILLSENVVDTFYDNYKDDFKVWINTILPEIEKCINQNQNNPWHKYNVMDHILHSVEEMNKQSINLPINDRKILAYTMFFHDIGKPACHIKRIVDGKERDSFFNHNLESERVCHRALPQLMSNNDDIEIICKLVNKHDIFMFIKDFKQNNQHWKTLSPKLIKDEIQDLNNVGDGKKLMRYLIMVGRSDNLSQNEKMTPPALRLLDKCDKILDEIDK